MDGSLGSFACASRPTASRGISNPQNRGFTDCLDVSMHASPTLQRRVDAIGRGSSGALLLLLKSK
eukprot:6079649-Amphidinium_carterae.1